MFLTVKRKTLWITTLALLVLCIFTLSIGSILTASPINKKVIVIDAGHGGSDGGVSGVNSGVTEAEINLLVAFSLKSELEQSGFKVVMTRDKKSVLTGDEKGKLTDMHKRRDIIDSACPDLVISIHCNKFPSQDRRGAQVFFNSASNSGILFAKALQHSLNGLNKEYVGREFSALKGDYFMLNCSTAPSAIVECGFLSNPSDEELLLSADYRGEIAKKIALGIGAYFAELYV